MSPADLVIFDDLLCPPARKYPYMIPHAMPAGLPYRAGLTRRQLRDLRALSGLTKPGNIRNWYAAGVKSGQLRYIPNLDPTTRPTTKVPRPSTRGRFRSIAGACSYPA